jgi:hypothetical protein
VNPDWTRRGQGYLLGTEITSVDDRVRFEQYLETLVDHKPQSTLINSVLNPQNPRLTESL